MSQPKDEDVTLWTSLVGVAGGGTLAGLLLLLFQHSLLAALACWIVSVPVLVLCWRRLGGRLW